MNQIRVGIAYPTRMHVSLETLFHDHPFAIIALVIMMLMWTMRRAAGRLAPRAALAPIVFLISRWPVLLAWAIGASGMCFLMLSQAIAHGHRAPSELLMLAGIGIFSGLGAAVPLAGLPFFVARSFTTPPKIALEPGEALLHERVANHFLGGEGRGGKLLVTTRRLAFQPHRFNVQLTTWSAPLETIYALAVEGDRFLLVTTAVATKPDWIVTARPDDLAAYLTAIQKRSEPERLAANDAALDAAGLPHPRPRA